MKLNSYQELIVWQKAMKLARGVYAITAAFPATERYGLVSQMRRAAVSIPSNISEGYSRGTTKEYMQFITIALGSANELETQTILSRNIGYLKDPEKLLPLLEEVKRMLVRLNQVLRNK